MKFDDGERREDILDAAREGRSIAGCARAGGVAESTLHRWLNDPEKSDFSERFTRARAEGERTLIERVKEQQGGARFLLAASFGYQKTSRHEVEASADVEADVQRRPLSIEDLYEAYPDEFAAIAQQVAEAERERKD